jgi:hypothetical protein
MERDRCQIAGCDERAGLNPVDVLFVAKTVSVDPGATRHLVPLCDQHRAEYDAGKLDLAARIGPPAERWMRRCKECGWIDLRGTYSSKGWAELRSHSGYGSEYTTQSPQCRNCGSLEIEGVLVDDLPEA